MNTFEKILVKEADNAIKEQESLVKEAKLLLTVNQQEERQLLQATGLFNAVAHVEDKNGKILQLKKSAEHFGKVIVTQEELSALCSKYRLRMEKASNYIGTIPPDLGAELLRWCKKTNIAIPASQSYSNFYIIAPPKMFKGYKSFGRIVSEQWHDQEQRRAERIRLEREDPILIYGLADGTFAVVKSWGDDFSSLRRFYAIMLSSAALKWMNFLVHVAALYAVVRGLLVLAHYCIDKTEAMPKEGAHPLWIILMVVVWIVVLMAYAIWVLNTDTSKFRRNVIREMTK